MTIEEILTHLKVDGFCVLRKVIPAGKVDAVRESRRGDSEVPRVPRGQGRAPDCL